jgi:hypothetical protein
MKRPPDGTGRLVPPGARPEPGILPGLSPGIRHPRDSDGLGRSRGMLGDSPPVRRWASPGRGAAAVWAATAGLPTLADPGYDGAGIGVHIPVKQPTGGRKLDIGTRNAVLRSLRCPGERGFALFTGRWRTLLHITASPSKSVTSPAPPSSSPIRARLYHMKSLRLSYCSYAVPRFVVRQPICG